MTPITKYLIRCFDVIFSLIGLVFGLPVLIAILIIGLIDTGSPIFLQMRLGRNQQPFILIKFRTMKKGTASVATHLASNNSITTVGAFLRKTKLDELPQLINVLIGQMSLIGPRPGLPNQFELTNERTKFSVFDARPGITGLGQINQIDMSTPRKLARYDKLMIDRMSLKLYFELIFATMQGKGNGDKINVKVR